jgi:hypothetical protein
VIAFRAKAEDDVTVLVARREAPGA